MPGMSCQAPAAVTLTHIGGLSRLARPGGCCRCLRTQQVLQDRPGTDRVGPPAWVQINML